ncbi:MAG TPA: hypothetical protein VMU14_17745 [Acidimicrobiales bacterium]|nr:hypothetical protein [Acidimicrobiales bacterium]
MNAMFTVHCPRHGTTVLLTADQIVRLVPTPSGVDLHWACWCGADGVEHIARLPEEVVAQ